MVRVFNRAVSAAFRAVGLEIRKRHREVPPDIPRASMSGVLLHLSRLGFSPRTIIDVGVGTQTEELYRSFPEAEILLVEPLAEFEPFLKSICERYRAQYVLAAAGEHQGFVTLNVHADKFGSSLLKEVEGALVDGVPRQVPMVTLDQVCSERNLRGPYVLKVDVQGAELLVLGGARQTLHTAEAVILEVALFTALINGPQLNDIVSRMREFGFVVYDIFGLHYRPLDNALSYIDMLFVREEGAFRKSHAYATPEQRMAQARDAEMSIVKAASKNP